MLSLVMALVALAVACAGEQRSARPPAACGYPPNPPCPCGYPPYPVCAPPSVPPQIGPAVTPFGWILPWAQIPVAWDQLPIPWPTGIPWLPRPDPRAPGSPAPGPSTPPPGAPPPPPPGPPPGADGWPPDWTRFEDDVLLEVNARRAHGAVCGNRPMPAAAPVQPHPALRSSARRHTIDMADHDFVEHTGSDGSQPHQRITASGFRGSTTGENVAGGYPTPRVVVDEWMTSPGHCLNIMHRDFAYMGVGFVHRPEKRYRYFWTQNFGG